MKFAELHFDVGLIDQAKSKLATMFALYMQHIHTVFSFLKNKK